MLANLLRQHNVHSHSKLLSCEECRRVCRSCYINEVSNCFTSDDASDHGNIKFFPVGKWIQITNTRSVGAGRDDDRLLCRSLVIVLLHHVGNRKLVVLFIDFTTGRRLVLRALNHLKIHFFLH